MTDLAWFVVILTSVGTSIIVCLFMEAYHQRRADEHVGVYDKEEGPRHSTQ